MVWFVHKFFIVQHLSLPSFQELARQILPFQYIFRLLSRCGIVYCYDFATASGCGLRGAREEAPVSPVLQRSNTARTRSN